MQFSKINAVRFHSSPPNTSGPDLSGSGQAGRALSIPHKNPVGRRFRKAKTRLSELRSGGMSEFCARAEYPAGRPFSRHPSLGPDVRLTRYGRRGGAPPGPLASIFLASGFPGLRARKSAWRRAIDKKASFLPGPTGRMLPFHGIATPSLAHDPGERRRIERLRSSRLRSGVFSRSRSEPLGTGGEKRSRIKTGLSKTIPVE